MALCTECGKNETNESDGICVGCKLDRKINGESPTKPDSKVVKKDKDKYGTCVIKGCKKRKFLRGHCYEHFIEVFGRDALPESMKPKSLRDTLKKNNPKPQKKIHKKKKHTKVIPQPTREEKIQALIHEYVKDLIKKDLEPILKELKEKISELEKVIS